MNSETEAYYRGQLAATLQAAQSVLVEGRSVLDAVSVAVSLLEDCPLFNAGRGGIIAADVHGTSPCRSTPKARIAAARVGEAPITAIYREERA